MGLLLDRYTDEQIAKWARLQADPRRHLFWAIPLAVWLLAFIPALPESIRFVCGIAFFCIFIGIYVLRRPGTILGKYKPTLLMWQKLVAQSDPALSMAVDFKLRDGETVHYHHSGERCEERKTGAVINTQTRTKNAVGSAVVGGLLFGPAGAIIGGGMARKQSTGTSTDIYDVTPVDTGDMIVTNHRFLFMGTRNTVDVPLENVMRFSSVTGTPRIVVEYPGRVAGESYTVPPLLFALCMSRRAKHPNFPIPEPPFPIPLSHAVPAAPIRLLPAEEASFSQIDA